ncbi:solute carrier family 12 member 2-like, partial [Actinia tenebrosa]|uniref:Solute carrier family 12 member 2-like n=1 Tax=Actinia tenebrosa TaxID=6105 RepID=A0A6P8HWR2_ACTTE
VNWGSSGQANTYMTALRLTNMLDNQAEHVKNFRPQFLVLTGHPSKHLALMTIVSQMSKNVGLMMYGNVYVGNGDVPEEDAIEEKKWLREHKIKAFRAATTAQNLRAGAQAMFNLSGLGKLRPNTVVLGYMENWRSESKDLASYFGIINDAFDFSYGLCILRMGDRELDIEDGISSDSETEAENQNQKKDVEKGVKQPLKAAPEPLSSEITFKEKQKGTIDVWWLYDDGGLTVLLPYLLTQHRLWGGCKLRLFSLDIRSKHTIKATELKMANLMKKFRITVSSVEQVSGANTNPSKKSLEAFKMLAGEEELEGGEVIDQKVLRTIRVGELVRERSKDANLVVISLPIPVAEVTTPNLYMSMLEALSADLPPVLLIRGNQSSVLTFYS